MSKLKTKKSAKKRLKVTGTGKVMRMKAGKSHLMGSFTGKRVRQLRNKALVSKGETKTYRRMLLAD